MSGDVVDKFSRHYTLLSKDDWIYAGLLGGSLLLALSQRCLLAERLMLPILRNSPGAIGFSVAFFVLGWKILYSIPIALFAGAMIKFWSYKDTVGLPRVVFFVVFVYLLLTRHLHEFFPIAELASQANALQLIITLRAIGLAFEVCDGRMAAAYPEGRVPNRRYLQDINPKPLAIFNYLYHYCGLFTGPYFTYQMFLDSSDKSCNFFFRNYLENGLSREIKLRASQLVWSVPLFVVVNKLFPLEGLRSDDVWEWSLFYRLFYAAMVFVVFRMRVYAAWALSEMVCVTLNIGIYPACSKPKIITGPSDIGAYLTSKNDPEADSNSIAIQNIDIGQVEASEGFRSGVRSWNRSVQSWLALNVYNRSPRQYRMVLTMFVSALWHGTYAGYFMSFLVVPMCTAAEDILFRLFPKDPTTGHRNRTFHYLYVATLRCRGFDFMATGFLLKNWADTHRFWSSLYYWLPITMVAVIVVGSAVEMALGGKKEKKERAEDSKAEEAEKLLKTN